MVARVIISRVTEVACTLDTALATIFPECRIFQQLSNAWSVLHLVEVVSLERISVGIFFPESRLLLDGDFHVHDEADRNLHHESTDYFENLEVNVAYRSVMKRNEPDPPTLIYFNGH